MLIAYFLTPWLPDKLKGPQLLKKFSAFYGTQKVHHLIHKISPPVPILSHIDPIHAPIPLHEDSF